MTKHDVDAGQDELELRRGKGTDSLGQATAVDGRDLRHVGHRSLGKPVVRAESATLPGASAHAIVLVNGTSTTVRKVLWLNASP